MTSEAQLKHEVVALIKELISLKFTPEREVEICKLLDIKCPDPEWSDYIFHSEEFCNSDGSFDVTRVVEKIFSYKPIQL